MAYQIPADGPGNKLSHGSISAGRRMMIQYTTKLANSSPVSCKVDAFYLRVGVRTARDGNDSSKLRIAQLSCRGRGGRRQ